jgi:hypothetical protein
LHKVETWQAQPCRASGATHQKQASPMIRYCPLRVDWSKLPPPANGFKKSAAADHVKLRTALAARAMGLFLFRMP